MNWGRLHHAYGPAIDTPGHLAALTSGDPEAVRTALDHLDTAVVRQGYLCDAAVPATRHIAHLLDTDAVPADLRVDLLNYLDAVAVGTQSMSELSPVDALVPALRQVLVDTFPVVARFIDDPSQPVRITATATAISYVKAAPLPREWHILLIVLHGRAATEPATDRALWVSALGDLDGGTEDYLDDEDRVVRVAAALAPCNNDHAGATDLLVQALTDWGHEWTPTTTVFTLPTLITTTLPRITDLNRLTPGATRIVADADWTDFGRTWGPLLHAAFTPPHTPGDPLTAFQRAVLTAATSNPRLWDPRNGSCRLVFQQAGLPYDSEACAALVAPDGSH